MSRMYQIYEDDLVELERIVPREFQHVSTDIRNTPRFRTACRTVKEILSNVRWNYQPHSEIEDIPAE